MYTLKFVSKDAIGDRHVCREYTVGCDEFIRADYFDMQNNAPSYDTYDWYVPFVIDDSSDFMTIFELSRHGTPFRNIAVQNCAVYVMNNQGKTIDRFEIV